jgi:hypothetical protein
MNGHARRGIGAAECPQSARFPHAQDIFTKN